MQTADADVDEQQTSDEPWVVCSCYTCKRMFTNSWACTGTFEIGTRNEEMEYLGLKSACATIGFFTMESEVSNVRRSKRHTGAECRRRHQRKRSELQSEPAIML